MLGPAADDWMLPTERATEIAERLRIASQRARPVVRSTRHGRSSDEPTQRRSPICGALREAVRAKREGTAHGIFARTASDQMSRLLGQFTTASGRCSEAEGAATEFSRVQRRGTVLATGSRVVSSSEAHVLWLAAFDSFAY